MFARLVATSMIPRRAIKVQEFLLELPLRICPTHGFVLGAAFPKIDLRR